MQCSECDYEPLEGDEYCRECGSEIETFSCDCGADVYDGDNFCHKCGAELQDGEESAQAPLDQPSPAPQPSQPYNQGF